MINSRKKIRETFRVVNNSNDSFKNKQLFVKFLFIFRFCSQKSFFYKKYQTVHCHRTADKTIKILNYSGVQN